MRIVVFGAGALGSLVGGLLSKENDVTLVCRKFHAEAIKERGLKISGLEDITVKPTVTTNLRAITKPPDVIILTVKSYDTETVAAQIKKQYPRGVKVLSLQNGLGNIEALVKVLGKDRVLAGLTSHGVTFMGNGQVEHAGIGDTVIGAPWGIPPAMLDEITKALSRAGFVCRLSKNIQGELWSKAIVNAGINPITAITELENGYLLEIPELTGVLEAACIEGIEVAYRMGIDLPQPDPVSRAKQVAHLTARNRSSMLQDIDRQKKTEIDAITGAIVRAGVKCDVKTPVNESLYAMVKAKEYRYL